ncbi:MAG: twin-arginine translocase TatA/TatE family subunit [Bacteroidales bacterium]|jgi:sec-independent protein translocase protein TatA|nr:twin-arginine translocase TatA/TatE family subunit [Bacteroidales bacterium]
MNILLFLGSLGVPELIVIALIILLLFGGKKIPEMMRGLGKGVKSFKDGMNGTDASENAEQKKDTTPNNNEQ